MDLSLTDTGIAVLTSSGLLMHVQSVQTSPKDGGRIERCDFIANRIGEVVNSYSPQWIFIEDYAYSRRTNLATLGELGGIVKRELWMVTGVAECWMTVTSTECKKYMTGSAAAQGGKERMVAAAQPYYWAASITGDITENHNVADAIGVAATGISLYATA